MSNDDSKWYVWRKHKKQPDEWIGFITDLKTGHAWIKAQAKKGRTGYVVNNVPPPGRARMLDTSTTVQKRVKTPAATVRPAQANVASEKASAEVKAVKKTAAKRLAKHKRDEAAEGGHLDIPR